MGNKLSLLLLRDFLYLKDRNLSLVVSRIQKWIVCRKNGDREGVGKNLRHTSKKKQPRSQLPASLPSSYISKKKCRQCKIRLGAAYLEELPSVSIFLRSIGIVRLSPCSYLLWKYFDSFSMKLRLN